MPSPVQGLLSLLVPKATEEVTAAKTSFFSDVMVISLQFRPKSPGKTVRAPTRERVQDSRR